MSIVKIASGDFEKALGIATPKEKKKSAVLHRRSSDDNCSLRLNKNAWPTLLLPHISRAQK